MSSSKSKRESIIRKLGGAIALTVMISAWIITSGTSYDGEHYNIKIIENSGDFQTEVSGTADVRLCIPEFVMEQPVNTFQIFNEQDEIILEVDCHWHNRLVEIIPSWSGSSFDCEMVMNFGDYDTDADAGTSTDSGTEENDAGASTLTCTCSLSPAWNMGDSSTDGDAGVFSPKEECKGAFRAEARTTAGLWAEVIYSLKFVEAGEPCSCGAY